VGGREALTWNYLIVACALITILVGVAAAHRFTDEEVAASPLGINGHFTLMRPERQHCG